MSKFFPLTVKEISRLTPNSVAVTLTIPRKLQKEFTFLAGQYITIRHRSGEKEYRRSYSICSSPGEKDITVGIKKVEDGLFSVYANEQLRSGDVLEVLPPEGRFVFRPSEKGQNILAFVAGSGITPLMSIIRMALSSHNENSVVLVYGNQALEETMFYGELQDLQNKYTDRFHIQYLFSRSPEENSMFGRIERSTVNFILKNKFDETNFDKAYLCGPEPMIVLVREALLNSDFSEEQVLSELFTSEDDDSPQEVTEGKTNITVILDEMEYTFTMDHKEKVLDAALREKIDAPYSCQGGICSTCIAKVTEGSVVMDKNHILTDSELEEGYVLTCQSHPVTPTLKVDYDDV